MPVLSSSSSSNPATRLFIFSISSFLSLSHASHIKKCFTSSTSPLPHFLPSLLKSLHLPISTCSSAVPPLSFVSTLLIFLLFTPTHLALNPLTTISFSTHSFGWSVNSSAHNLLTSLHAQSVSMHFTSALDTSTCRSCPQSPPDEQIVHADFSAGPETSSIIYSTHWRVSSSSGGQDLPKSGATMELSVPARKQGWSSAPTHLYHLQETAVCQDSLSDDIQIPPGLSLGITEDPHWGLGSKAVFQAIPTGGQGDGGGPKEDLGSKGEEKGGADGYIRWLGTLP